MRRFGQSYGVSHVSECGDGVTDEINEPSTPVVLPGSMVYSLAVSVDRRNKDGRKYF